MNEENIHETKTYQHRVKIRLDTMTDATQFVSITTKIPGDVIVYDNNGMRVNAQSILGMLYALEFEELWCESDEDIRSHIERFAVDE